MNRVMMLMLIALAMATLLLILPFSASMGSASAGEASAATLETAEQLYVQGDYALAAELYRQVVDQGYGDGDLYYNLGVAYHGAGDLGRALWSLRRAEALSPRDIDIRTALASVQADLDASGAAEQPAGLARLLAASRSWVSTDELALMALALWVGLVSVLLVLLFSANARTARWTRRLGVVAGGALTVLLLLLGSRAGA